jgi:recombination protein RecT
VADTTENNEVRPDKALANTLKRNMPTIKALAGTLVSPDRLMRLALICAERNPLLYQCTWESQARAVAMSAEVNLEIGSALNHAYIVPRKKGGKWEAELQISAYGFAELAYRSGKVKSLWWYPVYEGDHFRYRLGASPDIEHEPSGDNEEDEKLTHAYAVAEMMTGGKILHVLSRNQIERLRLMNPAEKGGNFSPWKEHYAEMACAKVLRAISKRLPKSKELAKAMSFDDAATTGDLRLAESDVITAEFTEEKPGGTRADDVARKLGIDPGDGDGLNGLPVFD